MKINKTKFIIIIMMLLATQLLAFNAGTYECKNSRLIYIFQLTSDYKSKTYVNTGVTEATWEGTWEGKGNHAMIKSESEFFISKIGYKYLLSNSRGKDLGICIKKNENIVKNRNHVVKIYKAKILSYKDNSYRDEGYMQYDVSVKLLINEKVSEHTIYTNPNEIKLLIGKTIDIIYNKINNSVDMIYKEDGSKIYCSNI